MSSLFPLFREKRLNDEQTNNHLVLKFFIHNILPLFIQQSTKLHLQSKQLPITNESMICNDHAVSSLEKLSLGSAQIHRVITKTRRAKDQKTIIHRMFVQFPEGQVTAILGPSGSGKTTLLDFLTGSISGGAIGKGEVNFPNGNAYVPQGDRLHGFYTCYGYMMHYARLSGLAINEETKQTIDSLLKSLGLSSHKKTIVGDIFLRGLSGGQKRRLSVALEALTSPSTLFLDEPTSGLDSQSALQLVKFLSRYVREAPGRRVIFTIHQPSSFIWQQIDNVVLLSAGKLMYQGKRGFMEDFFEANNAPTPPNYNPADHYVTMVNADFTLHDNTDNISPDEWALSFTQWNARKGNGNDNDRISHFPNAYNEKNSSFFRGSKINAIVELTRRYFKNLVLNPGILGTRYAVIVCFCILINMVFVLQSLIGLSSHIYTLQPTPNQPTQSRDVFDTLALNWSFILELGRFDNIYLCSE